MEFELKKALNNNEKQSVVEPIENKLDETLNNNDFNNSNSSNSSKIQETENLVNKIYKRTFKILWLFVSIFAILILYYIINAIVPYNNTFDKILSIILVIAEISLGLSMFILDIINAIKILTTDFYDEEINQSRIIWGIFTIVILGWIASLIFCLIAKSRINAIKNKNS